MVDWVKVLVPRHYKQSLLDNPLLNWYDPKARLTDDGELVRAKRTGKDFVYRETQYKHLTLSIKYSGTILLTGSLHHFYHGGYNGNDFTALQLVEVLTEIEQGLHLDLSLCLLQNIEVSVNLSGLPLPSSDIISGLIATKVKGSRRLVPFKQQYLKDGNHYQRSDRAAYTFKLYDKAAHCKLPYQLLRYELHYRRSETIQADLQLETLYDLCDSACLDRIGTVLRHRFTQIILYDSSLPAKGKHLQFRNYHFWNDIKDNSDKLYYHRKRMATTSAKRGSNLHQVVLDSITETYDRLNTIPKWAKSATG